MSSSECNISPQNRESNLKPVSFCDYLKQNQLTVIKAMAFAGCVLALFGISYISWVAGPEFQGIRATLYWHCVAGGAALP